MKHEIFVMAAVVMLTVSSVGLFLRVFFSKVEAENTLLEKSRSRREERPQSDGHNDQRSRPEAQHDSTDPMEWVYGIGGAA